MAVEKHLRIDVKPVPEPIEPDRDWVPQPSPSSAELAARGMAELSETPFKLARRAVRAASHPMRTTRKVVEAGEALGEVAWNFTNPAPDVPLNAEIGSHRRFAWSRAELGQYKRIKDVFGGTVNDVVLTVVSGALRSWLRSRGLKTEGLELRALVPVSIRAEDEHGQLGNRIAAMRAPLPVYIEDPVKRLEAVKSAMLFTVTEALAIAAPEESVITPVILPVVATWAEASGAVMSTIRASDDTIRNEGNTKRKGTREDIGHPVF